MTRNSVFSLAVRSLDLAAPHGLPGQARQSLREGLIHPAKPIIQRVPRAAHGADGVGLLAAVDGLAQAPDMDVDGALVDIDLGAPDAVEQLLAREHAARPLHQKFQQAVFGRPQIDGAALRGRASFRGRARCRR